MNPLTAAIPLLVGLAWLYRGYKAYKLSKTIAATNEGVVTPRADMA